MLFAGVNGALPSQKRYSKTWSNFRPDMGFHNLRHTHALQLIDAGVDIMTISKRLGHAKPDIALHIYAHLFQKDDGKAAAAFNAGRIARVPIECKFRGLFYSEHALST